MRKTFIIAAMFLLSTFLTGCIDNGTGDKVGMLTKIADESVLGLCHSNEASIQRGGFNAGSGTNGAAFDFTIEDPALLKKAKELMDRQAEVKITYRSEAFTLCRSERKSENHFLTGIEELKPTADDTNVKSTSPTTGAREDVILKLFQVQAELLKELAAGR